MLPIQTIFHQISHIYELQTAPYLNKASYIDALFVYLRIMVLNNLPTSYKDHILLGSGIKHCGMAPCGPTVDNSLCILLNLWAVIENFHICITALKPS